MQILLTEKQNLGANHLGQRKCVYDTAKDRAKVIFLFFMQSTKTTTTKNPDTYKPDNPV